MILNEKLPQGNQLYICVLQGYTNEDMYNAYKKLTLSILYRNMQRHKFNESRYNLKKTTFKILSQ